ncbi:MAG: hypothetical protein JWP52_2797, partial [Rhizobacter sp.]|nr:hypothetical protein [Rhizobacter sp.]
MSFQRRTVLAAATAGMATLLALAASPALAQAFPDKAITF